MHHRFFLSFTLAALVTLTGCSDDASVTYHQDVEPVVADDCASCHHPDQSAPIDLHTYEAVEANADVSLAMMENDEMPPWPPDPECRQYHDQRLMDDEDVQLFRTWIEEGKARGEKPDDYEPFEPDQADEPDRRAAISDPPYEPREDLDDEYRCFLLDEDFDEDTYVTGTHVETGGAEVIHHANIFLVNPFYVDDVEQLEASESDPGYSCFGGPGFSSIDLVGAWVPGAQPIEVPEDAAIVIPEGSRLVMQTHFNTVFADPEPVDPEVTLYTREDAPDREVSAMPFADLQFEVPPGESEYEVVSTFEHRGDDPWEVIGAAAHMHEFGTETRVEIAHDDDTNACLLDIPDWDFNWQQAYRFLDDQWVEVQPGDEVRLSCTYDNSPGNQPFIDGEQQDPEPVTWGARTTDEMCLAFLMIIEDYDPDATDGEMCEEFVECRQTHDDCEEDPFSIGCIFNCGTREEDCGFCLLQESQECAEEFCDDEVEEAGPCLIDCAQGAQTGGDIDGCLEEECPEKRDDLQDCLQPPMESGQCNPYLEECNVQL